MNQGLWYPDTCRTFRGENGRQKWEELTMRALSGPMAAGVAANKYGINVLPAERPLEFGVLEISRGANAGDDADANESWQEEEGAKEDKQGEPEPVPKGYDLAGGREAALGGGGGGGSSSRQSTSSGRQQGGHAKAAPEPPRRGPVTLTLTVENAFPVPCVLESICLLPPDGEGAESPPFLVHGLTDRSLPVASVPLLPRTQFTFGVTCSGCQPAYLNKWLMLSFVRQLRGSMEASYDAALHTFTIGVRMTAMVVDPTTRLMLSPDAKPYVPQRDREWFDQPARWVVRHITEHPFAHSLLLSHSTKLTSTGPPHSVWDMFSTCAAAREQVQKGHYSELLALAGQAPSETTLGQYVDRYRALLWLEECQMRWDIRQYDMHNIRLEVAAPRPPRASFSAVLQVPGVTENRPRLVLGDVVLLRPARWPTSTRIRGGTGDEAPDSPPLEVHAVVSDVRQAKSQVTLVLPHGNELRAAGPVSVTASGMPIPRMGEQLYQKLLEASLQGNVLWHVRFGFPRHGLGFIHEALDDLQSADDINPLKGIGSFRSGNGASSGGNGASNGGNGARNGSNGKKGEAGGDGGALRAAETYLLPDESMLPVTFGEEAERPVLEWRDKATNALQRRAVSDIISGSMGALPYILYGPAGTGKTLTVIEAILQELARDPGTHVLACAPSDAAADIICSRLSESLGPKEMMRLNWWQRMVASTPPALLRYCCVDEERQVFGPPSLQEAMSKRIIVSTCGGAGLLRLLKLPRTHLSAIFVDESSQALEPELLIPLALAGPDTKIVLAGDPRQLGASVRNPTARTFGLDLSLQERLMARPIYSRMVASGGVVGSKANGGSSSSSAGRKNSERGACITKLMANYRSHEVLLEIPRRLFYEGQLERCADDATVDAMLNFEMLPEKKAFPLLFYGVDGLDMHELDSPSFFNPFEASAVCNIVKQLVSSRRVKVGTGDIGVISAFRKQVLKLRKQLRAEGYGGVNVGSVEDFQGQESKVIIISTVLSHRHSAERDANLGFLNNPKRFNVALTRARALAICVGNPTLLLGEDYWRDLLRYCADNGAYRGCPCPALQMAGAGSEDTDGLIEAVLRLSGTLGASLADEMYPTDLGSFYREDPQWRVIL